MPTRNPRINIVLEKPLYEAIRRIAKKEGVSISLKARDLLRDALEIHEDRILEDIVSRREKTFSPKDALTHDEVWKDIESLDKRQQNVVAKAIETRLGNEPERYGKPLRGSLKGYWKLRVGDVRVVFKIVKNEVYILGIINRRLVYEKIIKRL